MDCVENKNKECCGRTSFESINWSNKVIKMDKDIRSEMGIDPATDIEDILLSIQIKGSESLEPAFISCEDETFLDIFVLGVHGFRPTAVLKKNVLSIGVVGGKSPIEENEDDVMVIESSKDDFLNSYC